MLSTKTLLKDGRYCIDGPISSGTSGVIYLATDNIRKAQVALIERSSDSTGGGASLARIKHDGLVRVNDDFDYLSINYTATEPLSNDPFGADEPPKSGGEVEALFERLAAILLAMNAVRSESDEIESLEVFPGTIVKTADGEFKFLFPGSIGFVSCKSKITSPFLPLESVWDDLDHITQKAVYNSYGNESIDLLESRPDARTDVYSLGAIFYRLITGKVPLSAFDRQVQFLDDRIDPLTSPKAFNPAISEDQSSFLVRMLELKRERRFGSIEDAIFSLPSIPQPQDIVSIVAEDIVLLEIPNEMQPPLHAPLIARSGHLHANGERETVAIEHVQDPTDLPLPILMADIFEDPTPETPVLKVSFEMEQATTFEFGADITPPRRSIFGKPLVFAGAAVIAIAAGWGVFSFSTSGRAAGPGVSESPAASLADIATGTAESTPTPTPPTEVVESDVAESEPVQEVQATNLPGKPRTQIADSKGIRSPATKAATKTNSKKKLTVDDLINDN